MIKKIHHDKSKNTSSVKYFSCRFRFHPPASSLFLRVRGCLSGPRFPDFPDFVFPLGTSGRLRLLPNARSGGLASREWNLDKTNDTTRSAPLRICFRVFVCKRLSRRFPPQLYKYAVKTEFGNRTFSCFSTPVSHQSYVNIRSKPHSKNSFS